MNTQSQREHSILYQECRLRADWRHNNIQPTTRVTHTPLDVCIPLLYVEGHGSSVLWMSGRSVDVTLDTPHKPASAQDMTQHRGGLAGLADSAYCHACQQEDQEPGPRHWAGSVVVIETKSNTDYWRWVRRGSKPESSPGNQIWQAISTFSPLTEKNQPDKHVVFASQNVCSLCITFNCSETTCN